MDKFKICKEGKIYGETNNFESAKKFAQCLGKNAIVFYNRIVVYPK